jgi:hypothetical protein
MGLGGAFLAKYRSQKVYSQNIENVAVNSLSGEMVRASWLADDVSGPTDPD